MVILWNTFYFIVTLGLLVTIHEFGHFWVARKLGVKVLTFSVGFGKAIWQRRGKDGVNYVIAAIPLGGYVKMLDEREGDVSPEEQAFAFNRKSVWTRIAIVLAGPVANFALALFLFWWMFVSGITGYSTQMGEISPDSIAGKSGLKAGDFIEKVDGEPVLLLRDLVPVIALRMGEKDEMLLDVYSPENKRNRTIKLSLENWQVDNASPDLFGSLGLRHIKDDLKISTELSIVDEKTPAAIAGLKVGDRIKKFNGEILNHWDDLVLLIKSSPNQEVNLLVERNGELIDILVVIGSRKDKDKEIGYLGVSPKVPDTSIYLKTRSGGFFESFELAIEETGKTILVTAKLFKKLVTGDISTKSISGPLSIAEAAGGSARGGLIAFFSFVAMISVNLGFINLLPIPLLDGGHLLYYVIELVKGKPLSEKIQEVGLQVGMLMVFALMAIAIFNDLSRF